MYKRICCACLVVLFLLCGCTHTQKQQDIPNTTSDSITTAATTTTTSVHNATTTATTLADASATTSIIEGSNATTTTAPTATMTTQSDSVTPSSAGPSVTTVATSAASTTSTTQSSSITFKATVRENGQNKAVKGVNVTVYTDTNTSPAGSAVTNASGVAQMAIARGNSYRVVLSNLPTGYEANAEYLFSSSTVNITIRKKATQNELDHSGAQYEVGIKMTDFTLTDTDGKNYRLSTLLEEKKLIMLDFWFANCQPCKDEFPYFEAAVQKYGDRMQLLAVDPIDNSNTINNLRNQLNANASTAISFPMLRDTCNLYLGFDVTAYPTTVFIDSNGVILNIHVGAYPSEAALFAAIDRYLQ